MNLQEFLKKALREKWALGHFNFSELDQMRAIVEMCKTMASPVMLGTSEGEREHIGLLETVALRDALKKEFSIPIFLNADHTKSVEKAKAAIDAGYDSIHIDLSKLSLEENIAGTKEIVRYAKNKNSAISVEGEVGYLITESSKIYKENILISPESLTKPKEAVRFVEETEVDRFAPAVGNLHGIAANEPQLDFDLIKKIRETIPNEISLVLHGGSGIPDNQIKKAIEAGFSNIHISTELRVAYTTSLRENLSEYPDEVAIYKLDEKALEKMKEVLKQKLTLFKSINRI